MKTAHDIILKPVVTEHSSQEMMDGRYTFKVAKDANKLEIRAAAEKLFGVKVLSVATMNKDGKAKRVGVHAGRTAAWKKAVIKIDQNPERKSYLGKGGNAVTVNKKYKNNIEEFGVGQ